MLEKIYVNDAEAASRGAFHKKIRNQPEVAALRSFLNEWIVGRGEGLGARGEGARGVPDGDRETRGVADGDREERGRGSG